MRKRTYSSEPKSQMKSTFTTKLIHAYLSHDQYPNLLADDPSATIEFAYEIQKEFVQECISGFGDELSYTEANEYCICVLNVSISS